MADGKAKMFLFMVIGTCSTMASAMDFVHPGGINSKAELDFVKDRIKAGAQPWKSEFDQLKGSGYATRGANGLRAINSNGKDAEVSRDDAIGAYAQSLLWYFTDEDVYAQRFIAILNSWSTLQGFTAGRESVHQ